MIRKLMKPAVPFLVAAGVLGAAGAASADNYTTPVSPSDGCGGCVFKVDMTQCVTEPGQVDQSCPGIVTSPNCVAAEYGNWDPTTNVWDDTDPESGPPYYPCVTVA